MTHVFRSLWVGTKLSPYEQMCLRSFIDHGHKFELYTYFSELDVPSGVVVKNASDILPQSACFSYAEGFGAGSFSGGSNLFRYNLLSRLGGWWVDTDVVCLSSEIPEYARFFAREDEDFVNGAVLYFEPGDVLIDACRSEASAIGAQAKWGQIGPRLITKVATEQGSIEEAQPSSVCYPVHWSEALRMLLPSWSGHNRRKVGDALFLHLWNEVFMQAKVSKTVLPPWNSLLRQVAIDHPVRGWDGEYEVDRDREDTDGLLASMQARPLT